MSTLEDRIAALEDRLDQLAPPTDSLQASYLTVNPDGTIGADFTGHVHAQGLDLDAGSTSTPPSSDRIRWLRSSDGAAVADIYSNEGGGISTFQASAYAPAGDTTALSLLEGFAASNAVAGVKAVGVHGGGSYTSVRLTSAARTIEKNLLTDTGASDFPQLPGSVLRTQLLWGSFVAGSTAPTGTPSGGFTVTKLGVGQYQIAWSQAFADQGYAVTPAASSGYCDVLTGSRTVGTIDIELRSFADVLTDLNWNFIAAGVY